MSEEVKHFILIQEFNSRGTDMGTMILCWPEYGVDTTSMLTTSYLEDVTCENCLKILAYDNNQLSKTFVSILASTERWLASLQLRAYQRTMNVERALHNLRDVVQKAQVNYGFIKKERDPSTLPYTNKQTYDSIMASNARLMAEGKSEGLFEPCCLEHDTPMSICMLPVGHDA